MINPMLFFIGFQVDYYYKKLGELCKNEKDVPLGTLDDIEACKEIIKMCRTDNRKDKQHELRKKIIDYIAPNFQLNKKRLAIEE